MEALFSGLEEEALRLRGGHSSKECFVYALSAFLTHSLAPLSLPPPSPPLSLLGFLAISLGATRVVAPLYDGLQLLLNRLRAHVRQHAYVSIRRHSFTAACSFF